MKKSIKITCWTIGIVVVAAIATYFYRHRYDKYELTEEEQQTVMLEAKKQGKTLVAYFSWPATEEVDGTTCASLVNVDSKTIVLFTTHAGNRFCKTLRTAQDLLPTSPIV